MTDSIRPITVGIADAASAIGISPHTARRWIADGKLFGKHLGRRVVVPVKELERLVDGAPSTRPWQAETAT